MSMYVYLSKILPLLVLPIGVVIILLAAALLLILRGRRKIAAGLLAIALGVLWIASMPVVAARLYSSIEGRYPAISLDQVPDSGCIVLLGGAVSPPMPPRVDIEFNDSVDRVYKAAELYRAGKAPVVIVAAGNQPWSQSRWAEAELIRELLVEWRVPGDSILLEGSSRNTRENALYSKEIINTINCRQPLLVTSAAHMPRAVGAFKSVGVTVFPVSTDVRVAGHPGIGPADFLPSAVALSMTSDAIREWIGQKVYAWQGWN